MFCIIMEFIHRSSFAFTNYETRQKCLHNNVLQVVVSPPHLFNIYIHELPHVLALKHSPENWQALEMVL